MKLITRARRCAFLTLSIGVLAACGGGGAPQVLSIQATGIKTLQLDWPAEAGAVGYRLLFTAEGSANAELLATLPANTTAYTVDAFLPAQVNGRYTVQVCRNPLEEPDDPPECRDGPTAVVDNAVLNAAIGYFKASNQAGSHGTSAALSTDGRVLAIGTPGDDSAATGIGGDPGNTLADNSGAVYVFARGTSGWALQAYIKPDDTTADDRFGTSVSLSADGRRLAVAAPLRNGQEGAVYLFENSGVTWAQVARFVPPVPGEARRLGQSLALSAQGNTLVVTDIGNTDLNWPPEVHVYTRGPGGWLGARATLPPPETAIEVPALYARAVAISGDGNTIAVGSRTQKVDNTTSLTPGAVYVFTHGAGAWSMQARLTASNAGDTDSFGFSVAVSADGETLAVGAHNEDGPSSGVNGTDGDGLLNSGAVYVFGRAGSAWSQQAYVKASNPGDFDNFGYAVALSADGSVLAATAAYEESADQGLGGSGADDARYASGAAYVFRLSAAGWRQTAFVKASVPDMQDRFGESVALSGDGLTLAVGATGEDSASTGIGGDAQDNSRDGSGAIYLY